MRSVPLPFLSKITLLWTRAREPGPVSPVKVDSPLPFPWTQRGEIYTSLPCFHNGVHQVFRQTAQGHADICHADQQRVQVQLPFIPVVADEVTGG